MTGRRIAAFAFLVTLPALAVVQAQQAPAAAAANNNRPGKVFLSGENPGIRLVDKPEGGRNLTQVSFWRIHWSPVGLGHVCLVTTNDGKGPDGLRIALYDNRKLYDYMVNEVLGTFNKTFAEQPYTPIAAKFSPSGDSITNRRENCRSDKYNVELVWHDLQPGNLVDILPGTRPTNPFGLTFLRIPAARSEVIINGKPAPGTSIPGGGFLAFGETWIK